MQAFRKFQKLPYAEQKQDQKINNGSHTNADDEAEKLHAKAKGGKEMFYQVNTSYGQK